MAGNEEILFPKISHIKKRAFLTAFAHTGNVTKAAEAAQISRRIYQYWSDENSDQYDPDFVEALEDARKISVELLEYEARRRAIEGVEEPVYYKGEEVGTRLRYSDTLLIVLLKAHDPDKYAEHKKIEQTNTGEQTLNVRFHKPDSD